MFGLNINSSRKPYLTNCQFPSTCRSDYSRCIGELHSISFCKPGNEGVNSHPPCHSDLFRCGFMT